MWMFVTRCESVSDACGVSVPGLQEGKSGQEPETGGGNHYSFLWPFVSYVAVLRFSGLE